MTDGLRDGSPAAGSDDDITINDFMGLREIQDPDWDVPVGVHDWRRYIGAPLQRIWRSFSSEQRAVIALCAERQADAEDWD